MNVFQQSKSIAGLVGAGPHDCSTDVAVSSTFSGETAIAFEVNAPIDMGGGVIEREVLLRARFRVRISRGAIVQVHLVGSIYRETAWAGVADPEPSIDSATLIVTFEGLPNVTADATMVVYGEQS
jgi:hypothetical protein